MGAGEVFVLFFDDHGTRELLGRDQQVDHRLFGGVIFADHGQDVFGRQLLQHHHQSMVAFSVGQFHECRFGARYIACGN